MRDIYFFLPDYPEYSTGGIMYQQKIYEYAKKKARGIEKFGEFRFVKITRKSRILKLLIGFHYISKIPRKSIIVATNTEHIYFLLPRILFGFWKKHFYYMIICHLTSMENKKFLRDFVEHIFIRKADYLTTISETTEITLFENKLINKKIEVIPPGIEYKALYYLPERDENIYKLLCVGSIEERKGLIYVIEVMNKLKHRNFELNIAGKIFSNEYYDLLIEKIREYNIEDKVNFLGKVSDEKLKELYRTSHLFIFLSIWEGYGMVVAEASSFGVPVIASRLPSLEPLLDDGYNGYYVDLNDINKITEKIDLLLDDNELRKQMSLNALKKASGFVPWDEVCSQHFKILETLRNKLNINAKKN
ncbi:MAG TPA: glycosyltransferase family 4 protein [Ignavibacteria bacterium]